MYSKQEASQIRRQFWTVLGQYLRPLPGANGEAVNWLNYKTGIKHIYFRMDADNKSAAIAIELRSPDEEQRQAHYSQFFPFKQILDDITGEAWQWDQEAYDEHGVVYSRIGIRLTGVNIFDKETWPAIISFLKPRILALDAFWNQVKDFFG